MIKRIATLLLVAFVFTGAWWDEKKGATNTSTPAPSYNSYSTSSSTSSGDNSSADTYQEPAKETYQKPSKKSKTPAAAPADASANPNSTAAALKVLSEGNPDERKARMESLVRLSNALRKQRELKAQQEEER